MTKTGRHGFALILTLFLVLALMIAVTGSFLHSGRRGRTAVRTVDHVQMTWVGEGMIDRGVQMFYDYIRSAGFPPVVGGTSNVNDPDGVLKEFATAGTFAAHMGSWYEDFQTRHPDVAGTSASPIIRLVSVSVMDLTPVKTYGADYELTIKLKHERLGENRVYTQKLHVTTGRLFDYGVFYDKDLEIAAGPNWTLQGPIFSNKNVYLMSGQGNTLTLKTADSVGVEDYVLKSAGNIYFFFKTAIAPNYLLVNSYYRDAYPPGLPTTEGSPEMVGGSAFWPYSAPYTQPPVPSQPYQYIFSGDSLYKDWAGVNGSSIKVEVSGEEPKDLLKSGFGEHTAISLPSADPFPNDSSKCVGGGGGSVSCYRWPTVFSAWSRYSDQDYQAYGTQHMSLSTAFDPEHPRRLDPGWSEDNQVSDDPPINPRWEGLKDNSGKFLIEDNGKGNVKRQLLPVGASGLDLHALIDPLALDLNDDPRDPPNSESDQRVRRYKYQTWANVVLMCTDLSSSCTDYRAYADEMAADGTTVRTRLKEVSFSDLGVSMPADANFYDYRLKGTYKMLTIDVSVLRAFLDKEAGPVDDPDNINDHNLTKVILYVETNPLITGKRVNGSVAPDMVRLINARQIPEGGFSVITNGRLWVRGNYNTYSYSDTHVATECPSFADIIKVVNPCTPPPADLYSDSFGVLSNNWAVGGEGAAKDLSIRNVTGDLILNAAVVTGTLPSQLIKAKYGLRDYTVNDDTTHPVMPASVGAGVQRDLSRCLTGSFLSECNMLPKASEGPFWNQDGYNLGHSWINGGWQWGTGGGGRACAVDWNSVLDLPNAPRIDCPYTRDDSGYNFFYYWKKETATKMTDGVTLGHFPRLQTDFDSMYNSSSTFNRYATDNNLLKGTAYAKTCDKTDNTACAFADYVIDIPQPNDDWGLDHVPRKAVLPPAWMDPSTASIRVPAVTFMTGDSNRQFTTADTPPLPTAPYPGIPFMLASSYELGIPLTYGCVRDSLTIKRTQTVQPTCLDTVGDNQPGICSPGGGSCSNEVGNTIPCAPFAETTSTHSWPCTCDTAGTQYSSFARWGNASYPVEQLPGMPDTALPGFPGTPWTSDKYINSGICPPVAGPDPGINNLFYEQPSVWYRGGAYIPLYQPKYSGGLENLINFQETWALQTFHYLGTLVVPWDAKELKKTDGTPAFFESKYYKAPIRDYDYNERLRANPPPLPVASHQQIFSVIRRQFSERGED